jgi:hypothetical protein
MVFERILLLKKRTTLALLFLRADLYRENDRNLFREEFKKYVDARIDYFHAGTDLEKVKAAQKLSVEIQQQLWDHASRFSKDTGYVVASMQMIPALNSMIDITTTRQYGDLVHLPDTIIYLLVFIMLCLLIFTSAYMFGGKKKI